jgi:endonuclease YncB( thermonuclease family)
MKIVGNLHTKKAFCHWVGVFFIIRKCIPLSLLFIFFSISPSLFADSCDLKGKAEEVSWDYVVDGDTLWLKDGRKIRFAAINTPEIQHDDRPAEPLGDEAALALKKALSFSHKIKIQIVGKDYHGRILAHPFLSDGRSLSALLIEKGLAFQIFSESKDSYRACMRWLELKAREAKVGVWSKYSFEDIQSTRLKPGFQLLKGKVASVYNPNKGSFFWVDMEGPVALRFPKKEVDLDWLKTLKGKNIEFRGWLVDRRKRNKGKTHYKGWIIGIYSRDAIELQ